MPHRTRLTDLVESVLQDLGLRGAYHVDVYRGHALADWRVTLRPARTNLHELHLQFIIPADGEPDWTAIVAEAKRQIQSPTR